MKFLQRLRHWSLNKHKDGIPTPLWRAIVCEQRLPGRYLFLLHLPTLIRLNIVKKYQLMLKGYKPLNLNKDHPNNRFRIYKKGNSIVKVFNFYKSHASGIQTYMKLKDPREFKKFCHILYGLKTNKYLHNHICKRIKIMKNIGYETEFVEGINLHDLWLDVRKKDVNLNKITRKHITAAIANLIHCLNKIEKSSEIIGDWYLYNVIFDSKSKKLINVDVEGFYSCGRELVDIIPNVKEHLLEIQRGLI